MPLVDLTFPEGALTPEARAVLPSELTKLVLRWEEMPDTEFFRGISWVHVHELPGDAVTAAGEPVSGPVFRLDVTAPEGVLTERAKSGLIADLTEAVCRQAGLEDDAAAALRVWVLIHEVPDGNWGVAGQVVGSEALKQAAAAQASAEGATVST